MRLWSIHPKYLDSKGLVALWRESLLAKNVLEGKTHGYKNHPQLNRFKDSGKPVDSINQYLSHIYTEALGRNYKFDKHKIDWDFRKCELTVTSGQMNYEKIHLLNKLQMRDIVKLKELKEILIYEPHPLFKVIDGEVEKWEIVKEFEK